MGLLVDGRWQDFWYDTSSTGGRFQRTDAAFRHWVTVDGSAGPNGRGGFRAEPGLSSGAALASVGEIAMRLDLAREGLAKTLNGARDEAAIAKDARLAARRKQESAKRLGEKAAAEASRKAEKKQAHAVTGRTPRLKGETGA